MSSNFVNLKYLESAEWDQSQQRRVCNSRLLLLRSYCHIRHGDTTKQSAYIQKPQRQTWHTISIM